MNPLCPYCRTEIEADGGRMYCSACGTPHHQDCYEENGGCTVFGCAQAPADEPKISVTVPDLRQPNVASAAAVTEPVVPPADFGLNLPGGSSYMLFDAGSIAATAPMPLSTAEPALASVATTAPADYAVAAAAAPGVWPGPVPPPARPAQDSTFMAPPPPLAVSSAPPPPPPPGYGYPRTAGYAPPPSAQLSAAELYAGVGARKNRVVYVLLGLFLGVFGVHNFYAGYARRGAGQAALAFFSWILFSNGYGALTAWIWAVVEVCLVGKDADGVQFT